MEFDISNDIEKDDLNEQINIEGNEILREEETQLAQKLDAIEEYSLDRFEENIAVMENRKTGEIKNISRDILPEYAKEGDIINCINGKYFVNKQKTEEIEKKIQEQYENLWE